MKYKVQLSKLITEPWFQGFVKNELEPGIPPIPQFNPEDNTGVDKWKYQSGMREGYLLALTKLGVTDD